MVNDDIQYNSVMEVFPLPYNPIRWRMLDFIFVRNIFKSTSCLIFYRNVGCIYATIIYDFATQNSILFVQPIISIIIATICSTYSKGTVNSTIIE